MPARRSVCASLAMCVVALSVAVLSMPALQKQHLTVLERLAPKIERTAAITPNARRSIMELVERVRQSHGDARFDARRNAALARVTNLIAARDLATQTVSVGD